MNIKRVEGTRKLGANPNDEAARPRKLRRHFSESKDIHEDRGTRQKQTGHRR